MVINLKEHATLILFILQFVVFAPLVFYVTSFLNDYREFKKYTGLRLEQCVTYDRFDSRIEPIWQLLIEQEKRD